MARSILRVTDNEVEVVPPQLPSAFVPSSMINRLYNNTVFPANMGTHSIWDPIYTNDFVQPACGWIDGTIKMPFTAVGTYARDLYSFTHFVHGSFDYFQFFASIKRANGPLYQMWQLDFYLSNPATPEEYKFLTVVPPGTTPSGPNEVSWPVDGTDGPIFFTGPLPSTITTGATDELFTIFLQVKMTCKNLVSVSFTEIIPLPARGWYGIERMSLQTYKN